ncbi:MAG: hypothetical protein QM709_14420 [Spongiibacteraceae bacterium]
MALYFGLNRRSPGDRRVLDYGGRVERLGDRRKLGTDRYVIVLGVIGIDRLSLMIGFPTALLVASALVGVFVRI